MKSCLLVCCTLKSYWLRSEDDYNYISLYLHPDRLQYTLIRSATFYITDRCIFLHRCNFQAWILPVKLIKVKNQHKSTWGAKNCLWVSKQIILNLWKKEKKCMKQTPEAFEKNTCSERHTQNVVSEILGLLRATVSGVTKNVHRAGGRCLTSWADLECL